MTVQLGSDERQLAIIIDYWWDYHLDLMVRYLVTIQNSSPPNSVPPQGLLGTTFESVQGRRFQMAHPEHLQCGAYSQKVKKKP